MKSRFSSWPVLTLAALTFFSPLAVRADSYSGSETKIADSAPSQTISWRLDMNKAREEAYKNDKLLLLYFFSQESPECHRLEDVAFKDKRVLLLSQEFVPIPIDGEEGPGSGSMSAYGEKKYPLIPIIRMREEDLEVKEETVAYLNSAEGDTAGVFATKLAEQLEKHSLPRMRKAAMKGDLAALARMATVYTCLNKTSEAEFILDEAARAVAKKPTKHSQLAMADLALADLYIAGKDYSGAILMLEHATKVAEKGNLVEAQIKLGYCQLKKSNYKEAKANFQAVKNSPDASEDAKKIANEHLAKLGG